MLRWLIRVASSWKATYASPRSTLPSSSWLYAICSWFMRPRSIAIGSMLRVTIEVVAEHDGVPALLGGPSVHPVDPGAVSGAEHAMDLAVVAGEVVLGQQVDLERDLGHAADAGLVGRPRLLVEVATHRVGDVVVGEPLLGHLEVPVQHPFGGRLQREEEVARRCERGGRHRVLRDRLPAPRGITVQFRYGWYISSHDPRQNVRGPSLDHG